MTGKLSSYSNEVTRNCSNCAQKVGIEDDDDVLKVFQLQQNYPNPFNPSTIITYDLPEQSHVTLRVYNTLGEEVIVGINEIQSAGRQTIRINMNDQPSGIYFYRLIAGSFSDGKKMILVK